MDFDLEAEKRLALTLVLNPAAYDYAEGVSGRMFGSAQARAVFDAVRLVITRAQPVTPVTVQAAMVEAGAPGSVLPGWAKGSALGLPEVAAVAARIRELWAKRELAAQGRQIVEAAASEDSALTVERLSALIDQVELGSQPGAKSIGHLVMGFLEELERQTKDPSRKVFFETGFKALDTATGGLMVGELSVFAARPGNGKSSFVMALACNLASRGVPVGLFWLEDDHRDAVRRFLARRLAIEAFRFRGSPKAALEHITARHDFLEKADVPLFVDDAHGLTISDISARMRRMRREHGCRVFILDHMGEVRIERDQRWGDRHDLSIGQIARQYRDTAKELDAVPVLVSQMNRRSEQREAGELPRMSDLDGSGQVEQAARHIAFVQLYRDDKGSPTDRGALHLVKCSGGIPGSVDMKWDGTSMTWRDA